MSSALTPNLIHLPPSAGKACCLVLPARPAGQARRPNSLIHGWPVLVLAAPGRQRCRQGKTVCTATPIAAAAVAASAATDSSGVSAARLFLASTLPVVKVALFCVVGALASNKVGRGKLRLCMHNDFWLSHTHGPPNTTPCFTCQCTGVCSTQQHASWHHQGPLQFNSCTLHLQLAIPSIT